MPAVSAVVAVPAAVAVAALKPGAEVMVPPKGTDVLPMVTVLFASLEFAIAASDLMSAFTITSLAIAVTLLPEESISPVRSAFVVTVNALPSNAPVNVIALRLPLNGLYLRPLSVSIPCVPDAPSMNVG